MMGTTTLFKSGTHNNHRVKPYALMLLLAFGVSILALMVLHKFRETRIFSSIVKQKDQELLALHLLFQREKEFNKEARMKIEEMKTKVYSLRSQKLEQDRRFSEIKSTILTLRDERKVIESALQEKNKEIKMLTEGAMKNSSCEDLNMNLTGNSTENGESRELGDVQVSEKKANETVTADLSENSRNHKSGRRRHSKGKRWRDGVLRNRRLGQSLNEANENATIGGQYLQKLALSDNDNVGIEVRSANITHTVRNEGKSGEKSSQIKDDDLSGKLEKNEEDKGGKEAEEGEDEEDKGDVQRFSGFDHEDEAE